MGLGAGVGVEMGMAGMRAGSRMSRRQRGTGKEESGRRKDRGGSDPYGLLGPRLLCTSLSLPDVYLSC